VMSARDGIKPSSGPVRARIEIWASSFSFDIAHEISISRGKRRDLQSPVTYFASTIKISILKWQNVADDFYSPDYLRVALGTIFYASCGKIRAHRDGVTDDAAATRGMLARAQQHTATARVI